MIYDYASPYPALLSCYDFYHDHHSKCLLSILNTKVMTIIFIISKKLIHAGFWRRQIV